MTFTLKSGAGAGAGAGGGAGEADGVAPRLFVQKSVAGRFDAVPSSTSGAFEDVANWRGGRPQHVRVAGAELVMGRWWVGVEKGTRRRPGAVADSQDSAAADDFTLTVRQSVPARKITAE